MANRPTAKVILDNQNNLPRVKNRLSQFDVSELDSLWFNARHIGCRDQSKKSNCRAMTIYKNPNGKNDNPMVILPGFAGYRKNFVEDADDMLRMGYGPIYTIDFQGTGDSYKQYLEPNQNLKTVGDARLPGQPWVFMATSRINHTFENMLLKNSPAGMSQDQLSQDQLLQIGHVISVQPLLPGDVNVFEDYNADVNAVMALAVSENPDQKISVFAISAGGLSLMSAMSGLAVDSTDDFAPPEKKWVNRVRQIILESPMMRIKAVPGTMSLVGDVVQVAGHARDYADLDGGLEAFFRKALGHWDPNNQISHSPGRLGLNDNVQVWSGHGSAGATFGWVTEVLRKQVQLRGALDGAHLPTHQAAADKPKKMVDLETVLMRNQIPIVALISRADPVVDPEATQEFMAQLHTKDGQTNDLLRVCWFETAFHQPDLESDRYRDSFLQVLSDLAPAQPEGVMAIPERKVYGADRNHEPLRCGLPPRRG
jgi:alpha-beta hydrolase superfamily lysophospholipase